MSFLSSSSFQRRGKVNSGNLFNVAKLWAGTNKSLAIFSVSDSYFCFIILNIKWVWICSYFFVKFVFGITRYK